MTFPHRAALLCLATLAVPSVCLAASTDPLAGPEVKPAAYSSSLTADLPSAPGRVDAAPANGRGAADRMIRSSSMKPFSAFGIDVKLGVAGIGFDVATPLSQKWNLRGGASFFSYNVNTVTSDGYTVAGSLALKTVSMSADWFPLGGSWRLSPGVTLYNGNKLSANASIPGGSTFDLGDGSYVSSATDPVHGTLDLSFGNKAAPSITTGFGNLLPRKAGKHFSVPFEVGVEFIGSPKFTLALSGTACQQGQPPAIGCQPVATNPSTQQNVQIEQDQLNSDVSALRAYPILSIGFGYKF